MDQVDVIKILATLIGMAVGIWTIARSFRLDMQNTIDLLFQRFDDHKKDIDSKLFLISNTMDEKYVRVDLCNKTSGNIEGRLKSIDIKLSAMNAYLRDIKNGNNS